MTSLHLSRRRAEQFDALLDASPVAHAHGGTAFGRADQELAELLQLVTTLRDHPAVSGLEERATPRHAHTVQLRERLMVEAAEVLTPERAERHATLTLPPRRRGAPERRLAAAATVLVVLGGTAGMATAAEQSLPGQALYPVKRGIERVDVALSTSTAGKGRDVLHQASTRLDEVTQLAVGPIEGQVQIPRTMDEFTKQAHEGAQLMIRAYHETADPSTLQTVQDFAASEGNQVEALAQNTSVVEPEALTMAARALNEIQDSAISTCLADCTIDSGLVPVSTEVAATPVMRAADGTELGTGGLPTELGTVPAAGDVGTVPAAGDGSTAAPSDGSAVDSLPGLTGDPSTTSPLPPTFPIPGLPDLGGGTDPGTEPGTGTGADPSTGPGADPSTGPGDGGSSTPAPDPTPTPTPTTDPSPTPSPSDTPPPDTSTPTPTDTTSGGDSPTASAPDGSASASGPTDAAAAAGDAPSADAGDSGAVASP